MTESRKRVHSDEENFGLQSKCFVSQQMVEKSDKKLMQKVYGELQIVNNFEFSTKSFFFREDPQHDLRWCQSTSPVQSN